MLESIWIKKSAKIMEQVLLYMLYQFLGFLLNTHILLSERFLSVENRSSLLVERFLSVENRSTLLVVRDDWFKLKMLKSE